jgi:uncharacterized phage infection (PIP) family protein YhgE
MKTVKLTESQLEKIVKQMLLEQPEVESKGKKKDKKARCIPENVISLDEIAGKSDEFSRYTSGITKRSSGVNSMVDSLGILNNLRLFKDVKDGGAHLAYEMMNNLNRFRNKNYYDETTGDCNKAMDKIIELYKESEHGTELVKDIEKVLNLQTKEDEYTPSPRAKEYLKQSLNLVKGL